MLRKPHPGEMECLLSDAYALTLDPTRSGYPAYTDGIKSRAEFETELRKGFTQENWTLLLYEKAGAVLGYIAFFTIPEDLYLQTVVFSIRENTPGALAEFTAFCQESYPGYGLYLGFPGENTDAIGYLCVNGWKLLEKSYNYVLHLDSSGAPAPGGDVRIVTEENFADFRRLHDPAAGEMYWNSKRIWKDRKQWKIWLAYSDYRPVAALYCTGDELLQEIFGVDYADGIYDEEAHCKLLTAAIDGCREQGVKHMVYFNDGKSKQAAQAMGFTCVGEYNLFRKYLPRKGTEPCG